MREVWSKVLSWPKWLKGLVFAFLAVVVLVLLLSIWRSSTPEIGELKIAERADVEHRSVHVLKTVVADLPLIWVTGRLAHVSSTEVNIELLQDGKRLSGYPVHRPVTVKPYPNNYFSYMIKEPQEKWQKGHEYVVLVYSDNDKCNPWKPSVSFRVVKE